MKQRSTRKTSYVKLMARGYRILLRKDRALSLAVMLILLPYAAAEVLGTLSMQWLIDGVSQAAKGLTGVGTAVWFTSLAGLVSILQLIINSVNNYLSLSYGQRKGGRLRSLLNRKAGRIEPAAWEDPGHLDAINKAQEGIGELVGMYQSVNWVVAFYIPYFLFMGFYLYSLKPMLLVALILIFVPVILGQLVRAATFARLEDDVAPVRRAYEYYERCIGDREFFKETRMLGAFSYFHRLYRDALRLLNRHEWRAELRTRLVTLTLYVLTLIGYVGILFMLCVYLTRGEISVGAFAAVFSSIGTMFWQTSDLVEYTLGEMAKGSGKLRNLFAFLDLPERDAQGEPRPGDIALTDASFRYPGTEKDALRELTLTVRPGETIAIVGENGAGKTTLVRLLMGLLLPTRGSATIGGVPTSGIRPASLYEGASAVFQRFQRYKLSLRDNVRVSHIGRNDDDALRASLEKADVDLGDGSYPDGIETMLSREFDGVDLSGGQWQRVAIAKGFYRLHDTIVLDEPTAAIDPLEETRLYEKFVELSRAHTAIIVTHRLGSAKIADRIVVMKDGRIDDIGTQPELMAKNGYYAEMYRAQMKWYQ